MKNTPVGNVNGDTTTWADADQVISVASEYLSGKPGYIHMTPGSFPNSEELRIPRERGSYSIWLYSSECLVGIRNSHAIADYDTRTRIQGFLSLEIIISGGYDQLTANRELSNTDVPRIYLSSHTEGGFQFRQHKAGSHTQSLGIWIKPDFLRSEFGLDPESLPENMQGIFSLSENLTLTLPMTNNIKQLAQAIIEPPFDGKMQEQFVHAKITELFCTTLDYLKAPNTQISTSSSLSAAKTRALAETMATLDNQFVEPPSITDLARNVAMGRSSLSATFKEGLGITISQYVNRRRMGAARELLKDRELSISDIAQQVGFEDHSSFSRAFKRFFGSSPQQKRSEEI